MFLLLTGDSVETTDQGHWKQDRYRGMHVYLSVCVCVCVHMSWGVVQVFPLLYHQVAKLKTQMEAQKLEMVKYLTGTCLFLWDAMTAIFLMSL